MSEPSIKVPVDLTNPGQFFACCGLLELADRLWPGTEGWFEREQFCILTEERSKALSELLNGAKLLRFDVGDDSEAKNDVDETNDKDTVTEPIRLLWNDEKSAIDLDWWSERSLKPWAGSMKERVILRAMLDAIDPQSETPFNDLKRVQYQSPRLQRNGKPKKPTKKEPFYFDPRRGNKSHPLDSGFSPDTHKMEAECCPALEALCFIGLQRARPAPTDKANQSRYTVWTKHSLADPGLPVSLLGVVTTGIVPWPTLGNYVFDNYFRTDQRKHKTFSQATLERSTNV